MSGTPENPGGTVPAPTAPAGTATGSLRVEAWSGWRAVVGFGAVSLAAAMVYEEARSITGPLLASLGASAVVVGLVPAPGRWRRRRGVRCPGTRRSRRVFIAEGKGCRQRLVPGSARFFAARDPQILQPQAEDLAAT